MGNTAEGRQGGQPPNSPVGYKALPGRTPSIQHTTMITASVILTWGLCALWGVFHSQSSVDLLATVSRLRTLSLSSVSAFLQIAGYVPHFTSSADEPVY